MRIALFTEVFLPKVDGVVTRLLRTLDQLAELGHEVLIFAPGRPVAEYAGFPVVPVNSVPLICTVGVCLTPEANACWVACSTHGV